jgi:hypothetical protein
MQIRDLELWKELDDKQAATISGGSSDGIVSWSVEYSDVVRPSQQPTLGTITPPSGKIRGTLLF